MVSRCLLQRFTRVFCYENSVLLDSLGGILKSSWIDQLPKIWSNEISDDFGKPSLRFPLVKTVFKMFSLWRITVISGQNDVGLYNTEFLTDTDATYSSIFAVIHTYLSIKILFPCTLIILLSSQVSILAYMNLILLL